MPKLKTHKATQKRFKVKKSKTGTKVLKRQNGQDHFNSRESGKVKRNKRSDNTASTSLKKTVLKALPYS
jgi:ribosomal protein L35